MSKEYSPRIDLSFSRGVSAKSNLSISRLISGLYLVVSHLYLLLRRLPFIVDLGNDEPGCFEKVYHGNGNCNHPLLLCVVIQAFSC